MFSVSHVQVAIIEELVIGYETSLRSCRLFNPNGECWGSCAEHCVCIQRWGLEEQRWSGVFVCPWCRTEPQLANRKPVFKIVTCTKLCPGSVNSVMSLQFWVQVCHFQDLSLSLFRKLDFDSCVKSVTTEMPNKGQYTDSAILKGKCSFGAFAGDCVLCSWSFCISDCPKQTAGTECICLWPTKSLLLKAQRERDVPRSWMALRARVCT